MRYGVSVAAVAQLRRGAAYTMRRPLLGSLGNGEIDDATLAPCTAYPFAQRGPASRTAVAVWRVTACQNVGRNVKQV